MAFKQGLLAVILTGFFFAAESQAAIVSLPDFTELAESHSPTVVKVGAITEAKTSGNGQAIPEQDVPDMFKHFFEGKPEGQPNQRRRESGGSGFFVSSDGYILTNNHVIDGADEVTVWLTDRSEYHASVVGVDPRTDLALLKIDGKNFTPIKFGNSDKLKVGEWVLAIGSPFNLDYSVTAGIVSAMGRNIGENYIPFIQTDVAINPGNSGGPLFNLDGELVGINAQIFTRSGGYMGVSFAIPSNLAENVYLQILKNGKVSRGWLGVLIQQLNQDLAESYGLDKAQGALVSQVLSDSPAEKAGFKNGDIILRFNDIKISNSSELPPIVGSVLPGNKAKAEILRDGKRLILIVKIEELPSNETLAANSSLRPASPNNILNIVIESVSEEEAESLGEKGVKVLEVLSGPGRDAGLQSGDIITMVGSKSVADVDGLLSILDRLPRGRAFALRIMRNGSPMFIPIRIK